MAELNAKHRNALPESKFALPAQRAYPIDTRASQQFNEGHISKETRDRIFAAADRVLNSKYGV